MPTDIPSCPKNAYLQPLHVEIFNGRASLSFKILEPGVVRDKYIPPLNNSQIRHINKDLRLKGALGMCQKGGGLFAAFKNESEFNRSVRTKPRIYDQKLLLDSTVRIRGYKSPAAKEIDQPIKGTAEPRVMVEWGKFLFDQGSYAQATAIFQNAMQNSIALQPLVWFLKGMSELRLYELHNDKLPVPAVQNLEAAVESLQRFAESVPLNPLSWRALGKALYQLSFEYDDEFEKRELQYTALFAMTHAVIVEHTSEMEEQDLVEGGVHPADALLELGSVASELGYYTIAQFYLRHLDEYTPISSALKKFLNLDVKDIQSESAAKDNDKADYLKRLAKVHLAVNDQFSGENWTKATLERAIYFLNKAQKLDPKNFEATLTLALAHLRAENYDLADEAFKRATRLDDGKNAHLLVEALTSFGPQDVDAWKHLGMFLYHLSGQRPEEHEYSKVAWAALTKGITLLADDEDIEAQVANSLEDYAYEELLASLLTLATERGLFDAAITYLESADRLERIIDDFSYLLSKTVRPGEATYERELGGLRKLRDHLIEYESAPGIIEELDPEAEDWSTPGSSVVDRLDILIRLISDEPSKTVPETDDPEDPEAGNEDSNNTPLAPTGSTRGSTPISESFGKPSHSTRGISKGDSRPTTSLGSFDIREEESPPAAAIRPWRSAAALYRRRNSRGTNLHRSGPPFEVMRSPAFGAPGQQLWNELFLSVRPSGFPAY